MNGIVRSAPLKLITLRESFKINCKLLHDAILKDYSASSATIHLQPGRVSDNVFIPEGPARQIPSVDCPLSNYFLTGVDVHALKIVYSVSHLDGGEKVNRFDLLMEQCDLLDMAIDKFAHNTARVQEFEIVKTVLWQLYEGIILGDIAEQIRDITKETI